MYLSSLSLTVTHQFSVRSSLPADTRMLAAVCSCVSSTPYKSLAK
jgi:hypothetical protein